MTPDAICGHARALLRWALLLAIEVDQGKTRIETRSSGGRWAPRPVVYQSVHEPAKLAAIIAERGQKLGFFVGIAADIHCRSPIFGAKSTDAKSIKVWVRPVANEPSRSTDCDLDMPQARAFALALLDAPNATTQDIERMIGEVTQ